MRPTLPQRVGLNKPKASATITLDFLPPGPGSELRFFRTNAYWCGVGAAVAAAVIRLRKGNL